MIGEMQGGNDERSRAAALAVADDDDDGGDDGLEIDMDIAEGDDGDDNASAAAMGEAAGDDADDAARHGLNWIAVLDARLYAPQARPLRHADKYAAALYWSIQTMTSVGYGDILPTNTLEVLSGTFLMLVGARRVACHVPRAAVCFFFGISNFLFGKSHSSRPPPVSVPFFLVLVLRPPDEVTP